MTVQTSPTPNLSREEWAAVSIALHDAANGSCAAARPGLLGRLYRAVTGNAPATPLADPRLEAVRCFVYDSRRQRRPSQRMAPVLAEQGFNDRQIAALALLAA